MTTNHDRSIGIYGNLSFYNSCFHLCFWNYSLTFPYWQNACLFLRTKINNLISKVQFSSVTQSCLTLCDPMNCSTPGLPVPHHLLEFAQFLVHCIGDAVQPSHPPMPSSPSALNLSQHQGLFQWVVFCIRWPKYWSFKFSISPSSEYSGSVSVNILFKVLI